MVDTEDFSKIYIYKGKMYKTISVCESPTVTMQELGTENRINFGLRGLINKDFIELSNLKVNNDMLEVDNGES